MPPQSRCVLPQALSIVRLEGADALSTWHLRYVVPTMGFFFQGIAFGNGVFVAPMLVQSTGDAVSILRSSDGIVWTRQLTLGATPGGYAGKFEAGKFFFGDAVSSDGLVWTHSDAPGAFAYNGSYFIGGSSFFDSFPISCGFSASTNITDWIPIPVPHSRLAINGIAFGAGLFVAVESSAAEPQTSLILTSPDGFLWTYQREMASEYFYGIVYANGRFVASGARNNNTLINLISFDGTNWDVVTNSPPVEKYLNGLFVGYPNRQYITTSPDAYTWTTNSFVPGRGIMDIAFGAGTYVASVWNITNGGFWTEIWQSDPITNSPPAAPALAVAPYPGLTLTGTAGAHYGIEYRDTLATNGAWNVLTNVVLPSSQWLYFDREAFAHPGRFYRAVAE